MRAVCLRLGILLLLVMSSIAPVQAENDKLTAEEALASMSWIAGHWRSDDFETIYCSPDGGLILSLSKQYNPAGEAIFGEFEKFEVIGEEVVLTPYPGGERSEHSFPLKSCDPDHHRVVFENLEHDWPTQFLYESPNNHTLHIVVSGPGEGGEISSLEFTLKRVIEAPALEGSE